MNTILVGVDGSDNAYLALEEGIRQSRFYDAELHVVAIQDIPSFADTAGEAAGELEVADARARSIVDAAVNLAAEHGTAVLGHALVGHEVKRIIELADTLDANILVIGFMGVSALYDRVMGSTCASLMRLAPCSVMVVKPPRRLGKEDAR